MGAVATAAGTLLLRRAATAAPWRLTATWTARASIVNGAVVVLWWGRMVSWCEDDDEMMGSHGGTKSSSSSSRVWRRRWPPRGMSRMLTTAKYTQRSRTAYVLEG